MVDNQSHYTYCVKFCRERAPVSVMLAIGFALVVGVQLPSPINLLTVILAGVSMALFMFIIRLWDDLADRKVDALANPTRLIPSQPDSVPKLFSTSLVFCMVLLFINVGHPTAAALIFVGLCLFGLFFRFKDNLSVSLQLVILNSSLGLTAVYTHLLFGISTISAALYALLFTLGGLAHDCTHSVVDQNNVDPNTAHPLHLYNQRTLASVGLALFLTATAVGLCAYVMGFASTFFVVTLAAMALIIVSLNLRLIATPNEQHAKPFYSMGFVFFLLPGLIQFLSQRV